MRNFFKLIFLSSLGYIHANAQGNLCTSDNLWVNGTFENSKIGNHCDIFNPINAYPNSNYPYHGYTTFTYIGSGPAIQSNFVHEASFDHTYGTSSGHFLYCDPRYASGSTYQIKQEIKVKPGTTYSFSTWVTSMLNSDYASFPATIQLIVNGVAVSPALTVTGTATNWIQLSGSWNSGSATNAVAEIVAVSPQIGGHDFALDDIYFGAGSIEVNAGPDATVNIGQAYILGGQPTANYGASCDENYTYAWLPTTGFITATNIANPSIMLTSPGTYTYTVKVTDLNGQSCSDTVIITTSQETDIINTSTDDSKIKIYPNPIQNQFFIENDYQGNLFYYIFDITGRMIQNSKIALGDNRIETSELKNGIYYVRIKDINNDKLVKSAKIVKISE